MKKNSNNDLLKQLGKIATIAVSIFLGFCVAWIIYEIVTFALLVSCALIFAFFIYTNIIFRSRISVDDFVKVTDKQPLEGIVKMPLRSTKHEGIVVEIGYFFFVIGDPNGNMTKLPLYYALTKEITIR